VRNSNSSDERATNHSNNGRVAARIIKIAERRYS
jgi:hypothetical protein